MADHPVTKITAIVVLGHGFGCSSQRWCGDRPSIHTSRESDDILTCNRIRFFGCTLMFAAMPGWAMNQWLTVGTNTSGNSYYETT